MVFYNDFKQHVKSAEFLLSPPPSTFPVQVAASLASLARNLIEFKFKFERELVEHVLEL